jgi:DNA polymerase (family 10)
MSKNAEMVRIFNDIADLLELQGEDRFKPAAYRRAARSIESLGESLERVASRGELGAIPGVGPALKEKIEEFLATGKVPYYERLSSEVPSGIREIMRVPGVGPKTARRFMLELEVETPAELADAIREGRLNGLKGFGERKVALLREGLSALDAKGPERRTPVLLAWELSERVAAALRQASPGTEVTVAGSLRRGRETIGDIDLLVASPEGARIFETFGRLPGVEEVRLQGETKMTVIFAPGTQVDLRVVPPESLGAALQYFTGSKDHNIHLRTLARDRGLKVNEYGVYRGEELVAGRTEKEVYAAMGLPEIPPELREDRGEFEAAMEGRLPALVEEGALRGDLHVHPTEAPATLPTDWAAAARRLGLEYVGVVLSPELAGGGSAEALRARWRAAFGPLPVYFGVERSLGASSPLPEGVEYWVARAGPDAPPSHDLGGPDPLFLAHLPPPGSEMRGRWISWARSQEVGLEVNPFPEGEGLDSGEVRGVSGTEGALYVSATATRPEELDRLRLALKLARRGWATPATVANVGRPRVGRKR